MAENNQDYNRGGFITFIFVTVFVITFFIYLVMIHPGVDMGEKIKEVAATTDGAPVKAFDIGSVKEPWVESAEVAEYGASVYKANCVICHGDKGLGDGMGGASLNPKPRNLVEGKWKMGGDSTALFTTLSNGLAGSAMPAFKQLKPADRWALVQFIRSITQNKVADEASKLKDFASKAN